MSKTDIIVTQDMLDIFASFKADELIYGLWKEPMIDSAMLYLATVLNGMEYLIHKTVCSSTVE